MIFYSGVSCEACQYQSCRTVLCPHVYRFLDVGGNGCSLYFYEIWRFVSPALYPNERKGVRKALGIGTVMFFMGVLLGYFMVYPLTLRFLSTYQLSAAIENQISLNSYIDNFMMLVLCMDWRSNCRW